jgi:hypothetical protein
MQNLFTFLQQKGYNNNPLSARIIAEYIKVSAACLSRRLQEQQQPVLLLEARRLALLQETQQAAVLLEA